MSTKKYKIGYTQGVFDMFHIGHLNLLNHAKEQCERLIVGVNSDALVKEYKGIIPAINENDRVEIVKNIKAVDEAVIVGTLDKVATHQRIGFDVIFIGSDWKGNARWQKTEEALKPLGVEVVYIPHTDGISSTLLRESLCK